MNVKFPEKRQQSWDPGAGALVGIDINLDSEQAAIRISRIRIHEAKNQPALFLRVLADFLALETVDLLGALTFFTFLLPLFAVGVPAFLDFAFLEATRFEDDFLVEDFLLDFDFFEDFLFLEGFFEDLAADSSTTTCAAAWRAMGTRNGEQDT